MEELMTLKEMCIREGVTRRIVQGYEEKGLVSAVDTNKYGYLLYDGEAREKVKRIRLYQQFGFRLDEIKQLFMLSNIELKSKLEAQIVVMQGKCDEYEKLIHEAYEIISELED